LLRVSPKYELRFVAAAPTTPSAPEAIRGICETRLMFNMYGVLRIAGERERDWLAAYEEH
jgi:hypothetical protein